MAVCSSSFVNSGLSSLAFSLSLSPHLSVLASELYGLRLFSSGLSAYKKNLL